MAQDLLAVLAEAGQAISAKKGSMKVIDPSHPCLFYRRRAMMRDAHGIER
jgi:hypothetical protein